MTEQVLTADTGLFYCPIPAAIHPEVAAVAERALDWMTRMGLCPTERQRRRARGTHSAEFYGRITPEGSAAHLQIAAEWIYWAGAFDDMRCDEGREKGRADALIGLMGRLLRMLETLDARLAAGDEYLLALHDLAVRYAQCTTPVQLNRWVEAHRKWLFGVAQRRSIGAQGVMPDLDTYLTMRLHDAAGAPITAMIEMVNQREVPAAELDSPRIRALTELGGMIGALDNDRISRYKETHGDHEDHNLINVMMHQSECSAEQALADIVALRDRMMVLFLQLREQAQLQASAALQRYLADLGHMIRGHIDWSFTTARYRTLYSAGGSPTGTVNLQIGWASAPADSRIAAPALPTIAWWWQQLAA